MNTFPFRTNPQITAHAKQAIDGLVERRQPASLHGVPFGELAATASAFPARGFPRDRCVYAILSADGSRGRVGQGVLRDRLLGHYGAVVSHLSPGIEKKWSIPQPFVDMIVANGLMLPYVVFADDLTVEQARVGEAALFARLGHVRAGGFFINDRL